MARFKNEKEKEYRHDYNSDMLYNLVVATEKFKNVKSWYDIIEPYRNHSSIDKRSDKEIEKDIINKYNEIFGIK